MTNGIFGGSDIPKLSIQGKKFHVSATAKCWLQLLQRMELQLVSYNLYRHAWKTKMSILQVWEVSKAVSFADRQQTVHASVLPLAGLVEIMFIVWQSSFSFRAGVLPLWFFGILFARKQPCIILQRSARAGLPSVHGSAPVFHFYQ